MGLRALRPAAEQALPSRLFRAGRRVHSLPNIPNTVRADERASCVATRLHHRGGVRGLVHPGPCKGASSVTRAPGSQPVGQACLVAICSMSVSTSDTIQMLSHVEGQGVRIGWAPRATGRSQSVPRPGALSAACLDGSARYSRLAGADLRDLVNQWDGRTTC